MKTAMNFYHRHSTPKSNSSFLKVRETSSASKNGSQGSNGHRISVNIERESNALSNASDNRGDDKASEYYDRRRSQDNVRGNSGRSFSGNDGGEEVVPTALHSPQPSIIPKTVVVS